MPDPPAACVRMAQGSGAQGVSHDVSVRSTRDRTWPSRAVTPNGSKWPVPPSPGFRLQAASGFGPRASEVRLQASGRSGWFAVADVETWPDLTLDETPEA